MDDIVDQINAKSSSTGVAALINASGQVELSNKNGSLNSISLTEGTSNFFEVAGLAAEKQTESIQLSEEEALAQGYTIIKTAGDLDNIRNDLDGKYILMGDIDLSAYSNWSAIGTSSSNLFKGELNGNGYTISNLTIDSTSSHQGLFGFAYGATISNLNLSNVDVTSTSNYVGALVGYAANDTTITNVHILSGSVTGSSWVGGLVGNAHYADITQSSSAASVTSRSTSSAYIGGLVGVLSSSTISDSYATGSVTAKSTDTGEIDYVGGIAGCMAGSVSLIENSYAAGTITTANNLEGALVGCLNDGTVQNNYYRSGIASSAVEFYNSGTNSNNSSYTSVTDSTWISSGFSEDIWDFSGDGAPTLKSSVFKPSKETVTINITDADNVDEVLQKLKDKGLDVEIVDGHVVINGYTSVESISGTSDFGKYVGLQSGSISSSVSSTSASDGFYTYTGHAVEGLTDAETLGKPIAGLTAGTIYVNGQTVNVSATDSIQTVMSNIISKLNGDGTFIDWGYSDDNTIWIKTSAPLELESGTSNFLDLVGLTQDGFHQDSNFTEEEASVGFNQITGSVSGFEPGDSIGAIEVGDFTISQGEHSFTINVSEYDTIEALIDKINVSDDFEAGLDSQGRFYIRSKHESTDKIVVDTAGNTNIDEILGLNAGSFVGDISQDVGSDGWIQVTGSVQFGAGGGSSSSGSVQGSGNGGVVTGSNEVSNVIQTQVPGNDGFVQGANELGTQESADRFSTGKITGSDTLITEESLSQGGRIVGTNVVKTPELLAQGGKIVGTQILTQDTSVNATKFNLNGVEITVFNGTVSKAVDTINEYSQKTGVKAYLDSTGRFVLENIDTNSAATIFIEDSRAWGGDGTNFLDTIGIEEVYQVVKMEELEDIYLNGVRLRARSTNIDSWVESINSESSVTGVKAYINDDGKFVLENVDGSDKFISIHYSYEWPNESATVKEGGFLSTVGIDLTKETGLNGNSVYINDVKINDGIGFCGSIDEFIDTVNSKSSMTGVKAYVTDDGKFVLENIDGSSDYISLDCIGTGRCIWQDAGIWDWYNYDPVTTVSAGDVYINDIKISINAGSIDQAIDTINSYSSETGVSVRLDQDNNLVFENTDGSNTNITIKAGTSDILGVAGVSEQPKTSTVTTKEYSNVTGGTIIINGVEVTVNAGAINNAVSQINAKTSDTGVVVEIDSNERIVFKNADGSDTHITIEAGTSDFLTVAGIAEQGELSSDTSVVIPGSFSGSFILSSSTGESYTVNITDGMTLDDLINEINKSGYYTASLNDEGYFVVTAIEGITDLSFSGTSGVERYLGLVGGSASSGASQTTGKFDKYSTLTGTAVVNHNMTFSEGNFILTVGGKTAEIDVVDGESITSVINKINSSGLGVTASIQNDRFVITADNPGNISMTLKDGTSNFAELTGFVSEGGSQIVAQDKGSIATYTSANTAQSAQNAGISAGDFFIHLTDLNGNITDTVKINVSENESISSIIDKINNSGLGVTASINDEGKMVLTRDSSDTEGGILVTKGSSDFTTKIGFTEDGAQVVIQDKGASSTYISANTAESAQNAGISAGDFFVHLTDKSGAITDTVKISIAENESIASIMEKINNSGLGVTASINDEGKMVLTRDSSDTEGGVLVTKGSSDFTNKIGFTQGGAQNVTQDKGVLSTYTSANTAQSAQNSGISAGDFYVHLTDMSGNITDTVKITIGRNESITSIMEKINNSGLGVTASINDSGKMVITRNSSDTAGGILVTKGSSDFTNKIGFTSGGYQTPATEYGSQAVLTSVNQISTSQRFSEGDFTISIDDNGTIRKTTIDISASDTIYDIIDKINASGAGVTATLNANNRLVLTKDADTGEGSITVEKGSSDFTTIFGFSSGGVFNATHDSGEAATYTVLVSDKLAVSGKATMASLGVTAGSFRINGVEIAIKSTDTIDDVIGRINSVFSNSKYEDIGVTAEYKNNQIVLTSKKASSNARIEIESGSTNFTEVVGFTSIGSRDNAVETGQNAKFNIKLGDDQIGTDYDLALDLKDITNDDIYNGNNLIYLDVNGKVVEHANNAAITIEIKQTGETVIKIGQNLLDASINELNKFVGNFNKAMISSENEILSDDAEFAALINNIKTALTDDVADMRKIQQQLADIGITVDIRGGSNSNMGTVRLYLDREKYTQAFYDDSQHVMDLLIGKETAVGVEDGVLTRLNNVLYPEVNNKNGYFNKVPRTLQAVQKELNREITRTTFQLNELRLSVSGQTGVGDGLSDILAQLEEQYNMVNEAIANLNKQYASSVTRLILNKNNSGFNPIVT